MARRNRLWSGSESIGSIYSSRWLFSFRHTFRAQQPRQSAAMLLQTGIFTVDIASYPARHGATLTRKLIPSFFIKNSQSYRWSSTAAACDA